METSDILGGTLKITLANASQYLIMALFYIIVTKTKALKSQDFELLKQALPKPLAKYLNILEGIIVR